MPRQCEKALVCVQKELGREIMLTQKMLGESLGLIHTYKPQKRQDITYIELIVDNLQTEITGISGIFPAVNFPLFSQKSFLRTLPLHPISSV